MNLRFQMIDTDTGELLANTYCNYACNFADNKILDLESVLPGVSLLCVVFVVVVMITWNYVFRFWQRKNHLIFEFTR